MVEAKSIRTSMSRPSFYIIHFKVHLSDLAYLPGYVASTILDDDDDFRGMINPPCCRVYNII